MRRLLTVSTAAMLLAASGAWAESDNCLEYRAMAQLRFDPAVRSYVGTWYAFLGDELRLSFNRSAKCFEP